MQEKLIAELGKFASRLYDVRVALYGPEVAAELVEILSRHAKVEEPMAVLAERHNWPFVYYRRRVNPNDGPYTIELSDGYHIGREFRGDTYELAEAKARAYLMASEDKEGV